MGNSLAQTDGNPKHRFSKQLLHNNRSKDHAADSHSSPYSAVVDIIILLLVLGACGFLFTPYFKYLGTEAAEIFWVSCLITGEIVYQAPIACASGVITLVSFILAWEFYQYEGTRCDRPDCRGLRKARELEIQVERANRPPWAEDSPFRRDGEEIGADEKELEAELRRLAPPNGKAVLTLRASCGCPIVQFEAYGPKRGRKTKK